MLKTSYTYTTSYILYNSTEFFDPIGSLVSTLLVMCKCVSKCVSKCVTNHFVKSMD